MVNFTLSSYRREGRPRDGDGFRGDNQSRGGDREHQRHRPHEHQRRDPHNYGDHSGMNRERRRGDYDASASDEHRMSGNGREGGGGRERFQTRGMGRSDERRGVPRPEDGRRRERERMNERRQPRRERNEEEDISNYEYAIASSTCTNLGVLGAYRMTSISCKISQFGLTCN